MIHAQMEKMFNARSIAVVGAKRPDETQGKGFKGIFCAVHDYGYKGRLYPINPKVDSIIGIKAYKNLLELPEPVDLVIVSVPAPYVPGVLRECAQSGNKNVHIFTAGFKETGEPESMKLQKEIEEIATTHGLCVIGPNCMGICVPEHRIGTWIEPVTKVGPVSFLSQSGGHAQDFSNYAGKLGVGFSKIVSFGNALTLDSTDFLEYLAEDPKTEIITMYLEGVKNGRKLFDLVKRTSRVKPVIILKGGLTESGAKAVLSHTGSLAGQEQYWNAFFKQTGAIRAYSLEEMAHTTLALLRAGKPKGRGVVVFGAGGGVMVGASDACSRVGLSLPPFSEPMQNALRSFIPPAGNMIKNPLDAFFLFLDEPAHLAKTMDLISESKDLHMLIISLHLDWVDSTMFSQIALRIKTVCVEHLGGKPFVVCWRQTRDDQEFHHLALGFERGLLDSGIPVYRSFETAAMSLSKLAEYHLSLNFQSV
ncbi:MAG: CoA-binding protein [Proteobacteria bacterium]|nr:CoA-binding protein [Pseudomonadota bacterium]MBU4472227.1 CoA-binding protein [Pseudomonadota bacterium]MCG2750436.1 CoA-binding protein [Desulfobacteraceae bacterium]